MTVAKIHRLHPLYSAGLSSENICYSISWNIPLLSIVVASELSWKDGGRTRKRGEEEEEEKKDKKNKKVRQHGNRTKRLGEGGPSQRERLMILDF
jgi:hypothetical protein